jgi:lantibiotic biosynthesis protein
MVLTGRFALLPATVVDAVLANPDWRTEVLLMVRGSAMLQSGLLLSSPSLHRAIFASENPPSDKALLALASLILRAAFRPTPFGLFAAVGITQGPSRTRIGRIEGLAIHADIDLGWLMDLCRDLVAHTEVLGSLRVLANPLAVERGSRLYFEYVDLFDLGAPLGQYRRSSAALSPAVREALRLAADGIAAEQLARTLSSQLKGYGHAETFVLGLLRAGILVPEFVGNPLGDPRADGLAALDALSEPVGQRVRSIRGRLQKNRRNSDFEQSVSELQAIQPTERSPVHVNAVTDIGYPLFEVEIGDAVNLADILANASPPSADAAPYRRLFLRRYESPARVVSLADFASAACDDQELLRDLQSPIQSPARRHRTLSRIAGMAARAGMVEHDLDADDLQSLFFSRGDETMPTTTAEIGFEVIRGASAGGLGHLVIPAAFAGSPRAGATVGRFAAIQRDLADQLRSYHRATISSVEAVEIAATPGSGAHANVAIRPHTTNLRIDIGRKTTADGVVALSDLDVTMRANRLVLWDRARERFVHPVFTTMHRADLYGPSVVRFLWALSTDGFDVVRPFTWGALEALPFRPRLRYRRCVLARASWTIDFSKVETGRILDELDVFRREFAMPDRVSLVDEDSVEHVIPTDLGAPLGRALLVDHVRRGATKRITLQERLPDVGDTWLESAEGTHRAEFVLSLTAVQRLAGLAPPPPLPDVTDHPAWLFYKWYCDPIDADRVVGLASALITSAPPGSLRNWHFVRYRDPEFHLRFRVEPELHDAWRDRLDAFSSDLVKQRTIRRFETAPYEPEVERYGGYRYLERFESLFTSSSEAAVRDLGGKRSSNQRIHAALESFNEFALSALLPQQLESFVDNMNIERTPMNQGERGILRGLRPIRLVAGVDSVDCLGFAPALAIASSLHLHLNRYGLSGRAEESANRIEWHLARTAIVKKDAAC